MLRDPPHYLRRLSTTTTPRRLLWLDCQAETHTEHGIHVDRFHHGALGATWWTSKAGQRRDQLESYADAGELWTAASSFCGPGKRVVLWAHDLAYQLRVSRGLIHLPETGWLLDRIVLERTASWALFRQGKRTLMMCDLKSWAPAEIEQLATDLRIPPPAVPARFEPAVDQAAECHWRATIIRESVLQILDWIRAEQLGPFRPTGSGQSYAGFKRRFLAHQLLVHDDTVRLEAERLAMWTGRCEAWQHGSLDAGPYVEYDLQAAYCTIAAECPVPAVAGPVLKGPRPERLQAALARGAVLAECEIETSVPVVPTRLGDRTVWPVGRFRTVLWDPELRLALEQADRVKVTRAWCYHTAPALADFAGWVLRGLVAERVAGRPVCARVLKHWSRCLVGRLGLRYRQWQRFGTCPIPDLRLVTYIDADAGTSTDLLCAGHQRLILAGMAEATDSLPQIPGWIMSECRRRLWEAMSRVGLPAVVYIDTDSMILAPQLAGRSPAELGRVVGPAWTVKGRYSRLVIHGPRNLTAQDARRVAGLPLTARQVAPLEFTGQIMRSIKESMRAGELDHVAQIPRRFVLDAPDLRRAHLPGGSTEPYSIGPR